MNDKLLAFLGIAKKSGKLQAGYDEVIKSIKNNKSKLIMFASDYSKKSSEKIKTLCREKNIKTHTLNYNMLQLNLINNKPTGVITVNDINFSKKINELISN